MIRLDSNSNESVIGIAKSNRGNGGTNHVSPSMPHSGSIAEADSNATRIFELQKEPTLTCGGPESMMASAQHVASHTGNYDTAQQLLAVKLQAVTSGASPQID